MFQRDSRARVSSETQKGQRGFKLTDLHCIQEYWE